jgi:hypothetical protein
LAKRDLMQESLPVRPEHGRQRIAGAFADHDDSLALRDLGIAKKQSSDWQKLAAVPAKQFEMALADRTAKPMTDTA